jgi:hypothetical protein
MFSGGVRGIGDTPLLNWLLGMFGNLSLDGKLS